MPSTVWALVWKACLSTAAKPTTCSPIFEALRIPTTARFQLQRKMGRKHNLPAKFRPSAEQRLRRRWSSSGSRLQRHSAPWLSYLHIHSLQPGFPKPSAALPPGIASSSSLQATRRESRHPEWPMDHLQASSSVNGWNWNGSPAEVVWLQWPALQPWVAVNFSAC